MAVIVPEGVLFGSTGAHKELRRTLLLENELEGVISLPAGVFQPYTGVKTSILVFKKAGVPCSQGVEPYTRQVWFYEIAADGYSLDAKRDERPTPNDLWDALGKWPARTEDKGEYIQPEFFIWRFQPIDERAARLFPDEPEVQQSLDDSYERAIHELFPSLPADPQAATAQILAAQANRINDLFLGVVGAAEPDAEQAAQAKRKPEQAARKVFDDRLRELTRAFSEAARDMLENGYEDHGRKALGPLLSEARGAADEEVSQRLERIIAPLGQDPPTPLPPLPTDWQGEVRAIVREFARLDGYDVRLRSHTVVSISRGASDAPPEPKCWVAEVRKFIRDPEWRSADNVLEGSHDEHGALRQEYIADLIEREVFEQNGALKSEFRHLLDSGCIEANDYNLSAGRYKPLAHSSATHRPPKEIILKLHDLETAIQDGLAELLAMVEGAE